MPKGPRKPEKQDSIPSPPTSSGRKPVERLAYSGDIMNTVKGLEKRETSPPPSVRLAVTNDGMPSKQSRYPVALGESSSKESKPPVVRLAHVPGAQGDNTLMGQRGVTQLPTEKAPALLVSYVYVKEFLANQEKYCYRDWMMDSGAYSAYNSGKVIDLQEYIDFCHKILESDPTLVEIIALDVIGNGKGSLKNSLKMKKAGLEVIPVFHIGDDWGILKEYCSTFQKVGLSCRFGEPLKKSYWFYDQCFARGWPKKFHSFGWIGEKMLMKYPFHSGDSTSWEMGPCAFGRWNAFGGKLSVRGSEQNLRSEVEWYLELESRLQNRWKKAMEQLEASEMITSADGRTIRLSQKTSGRELGKGLEAPPPAVRLAASREGGGLERLENGLKKGPTVRLAVEPNAAGGKRIAKSLESESKNQEKGES